MNLTDELSAAWRAARVMDLPLTRLVIEADARAAGCWRLEEGHLVLAGFGWASDMAPHVSQGFQDATRRVSLDQAGLGIVQAAATAQPAIARLDPRTTGLDRSASWIAKFGAESSLAVPIKDAATGVVTGILAVSTAAWIEEGDSLWRTLVQLSNEFGPRFA